MVLRRRRARAPGLGRRRGLVAAAVGIWLAGNAPQVAHAADLPRPDAAIDFLAPERLADARPQWTAAHRREALLVGGALVWPDLSVGAVVDSNPFHLHRASGAAVGVEITPRLLVEEETALHRTDLYASGDLRLYPDLSAADAVEGRAGVLHDWLIRPDLTVRLQGDVARHADLFDSVTSVSPDNRGLIYETDTLGTGSVQKLFGRVFVVASGTVLRANFAADGHGSIVDRRLSDETVGTARARVGYLFPSTLYVFGESAANWRALDRVSATSSGVRAVGGVGAARVGLFDGELFAGGQSQSYQHQEASTPVLGGRVGWSPRRDWTVTAEFDEGFGEAEVATQAVALGTPTRTETATATIAYAASPRWRAQAEAGTAWVQYLGTARRDRLVYGDLRIDYALSRSFDVTGVVRLAALQSSLSAASYQRAAATLAATYHY